jgi:toxin ParE1/3/4
VGKKYRVQIAPKAESDIQTTHDYIARDKPRAAATWERAIRQKIQTLQSLPSRCEILPEAEDFEESTTEYRHLLVGNYRIIFSITGNQVLVLRVIHAAQLLHLNRLYE